MQYRTLGRTGLAVSPFTLGTMLFGGRTPRDEAYRLVDRALDVGLNSFDTADIYGRGASESILGEALQRSGKRDRVVLATKLHVSMDDSDPNARGNSRRHVLSACHASLKRLGTDHVDILYIHRPSTDIAIDETLRALDDLVRSGAVRYIGTSTFAAWQLVESLWASKEHNLNRFVVEQTPYHLLDRRVERELLPAATTYGFGVLAWSPLAGGFLTGKYRRDVLPEPDTRFADVQPDDEFGRRHFVHGAFDVAETVETMAREKDCTPTQLALAWCLNREGVTGAVLGARTLEQFDEQLGALDVQLTAEDRSRLDAVAPPGRANVPYYLDDRFADWRPARYRW